MKYLFSAIVGSALVALVIAGVFVGASLARKYLVREKENTGSDQSDQPSEVA